MILVGVGVLSAVESRVNREGPDAGDRRVDVAGRAAGQAASLLLARADLRPSASRRRKLSPSIATMSA